MIEKEEITSTEFPEGGNTTSTKGPPASLWGEARYKVHYKMHETNNGNHLCDEMRGGKKNIHNDHIDLMVSCQDEEILLCFLNDA